MWTASAPPVARALARHCTPPQPFFERWLQIPYAGKTSYRQEVVDGVGRCHFSRGELAEARRLLPEARRGWLTHSLAPLVQLWDGSWAEVDALAGDVLRGVLVPAVARPAAGHEDA